MEDSQISLTDTDFLMNDTQYPMQLADSFSSTTNLDRCGDGGHRSREKDEDDKGAIGERLSMAKLEIPSIVVHKNACDSGTNCNEPPRSSPVTKFRLSKQAEFEETDDDERYASTDTLVTTSNQEPCDDKRSSFDCETLPATISFEMGTTLDVAVESDSAVQSPVQIEEETLVKKDVAIRGNMAIAKKAASVDGSIQIDVDVSPGNISGTGQLKVRSESTSALPRQRSKDRIKDGYFSHPKVKLLQRSHAVRGDEDTFPPDLPVTDVGGGNVGNSLSVGSSQATKMVSSKHQRLGKQGSSGGSVDSNSSALSRDSSLEQYTDSTGVDLQQFIVDTLHKTQKDRLLLLKIEQDLIGLVKDSKRQHFRFPQMSGYQRMFVHRVAAFFGLDHNIDQLGTAVIVNKTKNTRIPDMRFRDQIRDELMPDEPKKSILKRDSSSLEDYKDLKSPERQLSSDGGSCPDRSSKSFEEREEEYGKSSSSQEGAVDSPFSRSHDGTHNSSRRSSQDDLRWPNEPRPWSSTDSDSSNRQSNKRLVITKTSASTESEPSGSSSGSSHPGRPGSGLMLGKSDSSESDKPIIGRSTSNKDSFLHPSTPSTRRATTSRVVPKASSFGGISVLVRADSAASTKSASPRLSKAESFSSSSGGCSSVSFRDTSGMEEEVDEHKEEETRRKTIISPEGASSSNLVQSTTSSIQTVASHLASTSSMAVGTSIQPTPTPAIYQGFQAPSWMVPQQGQPVMWAVSNMDSVPAGSILINPQTGQPFLNTDGSVYRHNPSSTVQVHPMIQMHNPYNNQLPITSQQTIGFGTRTPPTPVQSQSPFVMCAATSPPQQPAPPFEQRSFIIQEQPTATDLLASQLSAITFASPTTSMHPQQMSTDGILAMTGNTVLQLPNQLAPANSGFNGVVSRNPQQPQQKQTSSLYYSLPMAAATAVVGATINQPIQSPSPHQNNRYVQQMTYSFPQQQQQQQQQLTVNSSPLQLQGVSNIDGQSNSQLSMPAIPSQLPQPPLHQMQQQHQHCVQTYPTVFATYGQQQSQLDPNYYSVSTSANSSSTSAMFPHVSSGANFTFPTYAYTSPIPGSGYGLGLSQHQTQSILNNPSQILSTGGASFYAPPPSTQGQQIHNNNNINNNHNHNHNHHHQTVFRPQTPPTNQSQGLMANNQGRPNYTFVNHYPIPTNLYAAQRLPASPNVPGTIGVARTDWTTTPAQQQPGHYQQFEAQLSLHNQHPPPPPPPAIPPPGTSFVATALPVFRVQHSIQPHHVHHHQQQIVRPNTPPPPLNFSQSSQRTIMQGQQPYVMPTNSILNKAAAAGYGMSAVDHRFVKPSNDVTTYFMDASGGFVESKGVAAVSPLLSSNNGHPRSSLNAQVYSRGLPVVQGDFRLIGMPLQQHQMQTTVRVPIMLQSHHQPQPKFMLPNRFHFNSQGSFPATYCQGTTTVSSRPAKLRRQKSKGSSSIACTTSKSETASFADCETGEQPGNSILEIEGVPDGLKRTEAENYLDEVVGHGAKLLFVIRQGHGSSTPMPPSTSQQILTAAAKQHIYAVFETETEAQNALIHIKTSKYQLRQPQHNAGINVTTTAADAAAASSAVGSSTSTSTAAAPVPVDVCKVKSEL